MSTGSKGSPTSSTRSSSSPASKTSASASPSLHLVPGQRRGDGRPLARAKRVDPHGRLVTVVLAPVDEDLALAPLLAHRGQHELGVLLLEQTGDAVRERLGVVVGDVGVQRHVELHALRARGLHAALQRELGEHVAQQQRHLAALREPRGRPRVEVEREHGRRVRILGEGKGGMQLEVGEVGQPHQGREVVAEHELDRAVAGADRLRPHPLRRVRGLLLLVEVALLHAVGVALQRERATAQVRQQRRRHARVVVDDLALGEAGGRVEHLVEVGQAQLAPVDLDVDGLTSWQRSSWPWAWPSTSACRWRTSPSAWPWACSGACSARSRPPAPPSGPAPPPAPPASPAR